LPCTDKEHGDLPLTEGIPIRLLSLLTTICYSKPTKLAGKLNAVSVAAVRDGLHLLFERL
jgi:hypothetical protein